MEYLITLKSDTKAILRWEFKDKSYKYSKIEFTLDMPDLIIRFIPALWAKKEGYKIKKLRVKRFTNKSASYLIGKYSNLGRHFEEGVLTVYRDLGLPLYTYHAMRDV